MDRDALRRKIRDTLAEIVDQDVQITDATAAADVDWWDSLVHLKLLMALEEELGIEFEVADIKAPSNVGALIDLILAKL
jgi:acyl carrier protein